ncbi:MAG: DNA polymerase III subunit alpha [Planctomycetota bacterium]|nr:DNA polymerase III subunit alpha [Planctomycetota bacterium]
MYVPLRVHGHHSMLTGVDAPRELLERAAELGLPALALADVDTLSGIVDLARAAAKTPGVRPIFGAEISDPNGLPGRVVALAKDAEGWRNLCKLVSARQLGGDPGQASAKLEGPDAFRIVDAVVRWQAGLVLLVDHPRLLMELGGRVDERALFAAISPASIRVRTGRAGPRNAARDDFRRIDVRSAGLDAFDLRRRDDEELLETPKIPAPEPPVAAQDLVEAARACGVATLAVPDVYMANAASFVDHKARVAIKHNALVHDLPETWLAARPAHLVTAAEMRALYADLPEIPGPFPRSAQGALERTLAVADMCRFVPELGGIVFPTIALGPGETPYSRLAGLAFQGASERYRPLKPEVVRRLEYELTTIEKLGFSSYFLLVLQIADFARERGIPCVGRGSAADSLVAYCLRLTDADPLRYRLTFERFLNPARRDRPDIDLDFCWRRRDEVLAHVYDLFGAERTAMIATIATCGVRAAFRESALVEGVPPAEANRWSRRLPMYWSRASASKGADRPGIAGELGLVGPDRGAPDPGPSDGVRHDAGSHVGFARPGGTARRGTAPRGTTRRGTTRSGRVAQHGTTAPPVLPAMLAGNELAELLARTPEAHGFPFDDPRMQRVLQAADRLAGAPRHYGLHPGGVVVAPGPITDFVPCQRAAKGCIVTQFDKDAVEAIGLVKMDLLGNRALTTLDDCVKSLARQGVVVDLESLPEDDPATARTLREGRTLGCFQIESPGMRNLLQQIGARTMDDVIQAVALIRPGPAGSGMKDAYVRRYRGLEPRHAPHPRLEELLWDTYGVMLYQEDVMQVAARLAGMDLAEADLLRRALQKRRTNEIPALCERFVAGSIEQGVTREDALRVWDLISNFASFGFCKAHAVTYGRISYRAAWLKTHYPAAYLAAFLESETGYYDPRVYVEEARRLGVAILPPDVNQSAARTWRPRTAPCGAWLTSTEFGSGDSAAHGTAPDSPLPNSVEVSQAPYGAVRGGNDIRVPLGQVRGVSERALEAIVAAREAGGRFVSLPDFLERTGAQGDEAEALIRCGAFDGFDRTIPELLWRLHLLRAPARRVPKDAGLDARELAALRATPGSREAARAKDPLTAARAKTAGWTGAGIGAGNVDLAPGETASLFGPPETGAPALPRLADHDRLTRGRLEHEVLGLTVSAHPTALFPCPADARIAAREGLGHERARPVNPIVAREVPQRAGARVTLRGWPAATRHVRTSDGRTMRFLTLEDETGLAEVVVFADVYERDGAHLAEAGVLCVTGTVEDQMGACTLHAEVIW